MPKLLVNGANLHYRQRGAGTDVILLHGIATNMTYWLLTVMPRLAPHHRATVYDLRGHGLSDLTESGYTSGELAEDLRGLMDDLDIERAHVVGHSYGGVVALHHAARYPERVRSLTIVDSAIPALRRHMPLSEWPGHARARQRLKSYGVTMPEDPNGWDPGDLLVKLTQLPTFASKWRGLPVQDRGVQRLGTSTSCIDDMRVIGDLSEDRILAVTMPTLAIYDETGPFLGIGRYLAEHLSDCRLLVQDVSHFIPPVAPEALAGPLLTHFAVAERESGSTRSRTVESARPDGRDA